MDFGLIQKGSAIDPKGNLKIGVDQRVADVFQHTCTHQLRIVLPKPRGCSSTEEGKCTHTLSLSLGIFCKRHLGSRR